MNLQSGLILLIARRFLPPSALALFAGALALAFFLPWSPNAALGANELSAEVGAGLARQGVWLSALAVALPWFCARASWCVRQWREGDGDWLGTGVLSRGGVAVCHVCGAAIALVIALAPFAIAAELLAGNSLPRLRWVADAKVDSVVLLAEADRVSVSVDPPPEASVALARFVIAAPSDGGARALLRCSVERTGSVNFSREVLVTESTPFEIEIPSGSGVTKMTFERVGPGAVVVLEDSRLQMFASRPARWTTMLALFLHVWLACCVACAIALGVAAWASAGTAILSAFVVLALAWLGENFPLPWPGVGLRDALELCADGLAPGFPALITWIGAAVLCAAALAFVALQRDLWRRDA